MAKTLHSPAAVDAIILAAGKGTRMAGGQSDAQVHPLAKVLYPAADRPMIQWVVQACVDAGVSRCVVIVGWMADQVRESLSTYPAVQFATQEQQLGTGHATRMAESLLDPTAEAHRERDVFVLCGDGPLIRADTLTRLLDMHRQQQADATLATAHLPDPTGYGRIVRDAHGRFDRIVEQKDATEQQRLIDEVNPSYYCFKLGVLFDQLSKLSTGNAQGEYYLTDVPGMIKRSGGRVELMDAVPAEDVMGVNTPEQLARVDELLRAREHGVRRTLTS